MTEETKLSFKKLNKVLQRLEEVIQIPISPDRIEIDASIQCFEFSFELFWRALNEKLIDDYGVIVYGIKTTLQHAYTNKLISNEGMWLAILKDRSLTPDTYQDDLADQIYHNIKKYTPFLRQEFEKCQKTP